MDGQGPTLRCTCQPTSETTWAGERSPSRAIVDTLAAAEDVDSLDLEPLSADVDPDAIDALFDGLTSDPQRILTFSVRDWNVFVRGDGHITVCDATCETTPSPVFESAADD